MRLPSTRCFAALLTVLGLQLAIPSPHGNGGAGTGPSLALELIDFSPHPSGFYQAQFDVMLETGGEPIQAFELRADMASELATVALPSPHPAFDDDGELFGDAEVAPGQTTRIIDLRHGAGSAAGDGPLARLQVAIWADTFVTVSGRVARPDGAVLDAVPSNLIYLPGPTQ